MKSIIIAAALMTLSILPVNAKAASYRMDGNKPKIVIVDTDEKTPSRSPGIYDLDIEVESINNTLCIIFTGTLPDADITVTDDLGNIVVNQSSVTITTGMTLYITPDNYYPYEIVITSPTLDIVGQIVDE